MTHTRHPVAALLVAALLLAPGCSLKKIAINSVADSLSKSGDTFASDADPELIRDAVPFSLKLVESLLVEVPEHRGLLLTACSGFTQYAYAFIDTDAELAKVDDYERYVKLQERARRMYLRGRDYCLRSMDVAQQGIRARFTADPSQAAALFRKKEDVPLLYWTAASWGKAVSLSLDRPELAGDFPIVRALATRALALDEAYGKGALHEIMITLESVPEAMGGSQARARQHFDRAVALSNGQSAGAYVSFATGVLLPQQQKAEFVKMLEAALAVDPDKEPPLRLANLISQQYARYLLDHLDDLFVSTPDAARRPYPVKETP